MFSLDADVAAFKKRARHVVEGTSHDQEALGEFLSKANDDVGQALTLLRAVPPQPVFSAQSLA